MSKNNQEYEAALKIFVDTMDAREKVKQKILDLNSKGLKIPEEYMDVDVLEPHWRKIPGVVRRIKQAARKAAENYIKAKKQCNK